ncbi:MAG: hypothetical protein LN412_04775 [Candidatus Thermoplasmatota archaeon]|nr:hypothetical protein [Candidatus Thermoplasmatota archaeon]
MFIALEGLVGFLSGVVEVYYDNPTIFLTVLFVFSILTAIILPIPVEVALLPIIDNLSLLGTAALVLGAGKAVGAGAIFVLGLRVEAPIRYWSARHRSVGKFVGYVTRFVRATRWMGLFILLAIPFFPDTVPIYIYSLFNKQGQLISGRIFLLVNFLAGMVRAFVFVLASQFGLGFLLG